MTARALLLTGTVGVGKTSVAAAVGDLLRERRVTSAVADLDVVHRRLRVRHVDDHDGLAWHLHRSGELAAIQDESAVEDLRLVVTGVAGKDAAARVLDLWHARDSRA